MHPRIKTLFEECPADVVLIRAGPLGNSANFEYFSGLDAKRFENHTLILEKNASKPILMISSLEKEARSPSNIRVFEMKNHTQLNSFLRKKIRGKKVGIDFATHPYAKVRVLEKEFKPKKVIDIAPAVSRIRGIKTKGEIKNIQTACKITVEILNKIPEFVRTHHTEASLSERLKTEAFKTVSELAYPPIVAFGTNAGVPHHIPDQTKIGKKNFLLIDFGVKYRGYCADISRTLFCGKPSEEDAWKYWVVYQAQQNALGTAKAGTRANAVFHAANEFIRKSLRLEIPHALGHGLGLNVHDYPTRMAADEKWTLQNGHVLTFEPAIYTKKFGIRIEDDAVIQNGEARRLTHAPHELISV